MKKRPLTDFHYTPEEFLALTSSEYDQLHGKICMGRDCYRDCELHVAVEAISPTTACTCYFNWDRDKLKFLEVFQRLGIVGYASEDDIVTAPVWEDEIGVIF